MHLAHSPDSDIIRLENLLSSMTLDNTTSVSPAKKLSNQETVSETPDTELNELTDFVQLVNNLPEQYRTDFYRAIDRLVDGFERRQRILGYIQDSLGQMNLDLKYLIFDLEATRRERDEYRRRLESLS